MPQTKKTFYVIDLDRCLADTDKFFTLFEHIIYEKTDITEEILKTAKQKIEQTGGSFDVISYLQEHYSLDVVVELKEAFVKEGREQDLFEPGARDILQFLTDNSLPFGILTYGGRVWQQTKLRAVGLETIPHIITGVQAKGEIIAGWQQPDGMFLIPSELGGGNFESVLLVDDKLLSFEGLPKAASGIRVLTKSMPLSENPYPESVVQVRGLSEAEALIKSKIRI